MAFEIRHRDWTDFDITSDAGRGPVHYIDMFATLSGETAPPLASDHAAKGDSDQYARVYEWVVGLTCTSSDVFDWISFAENLVVQIRFIYEPEQVVVQDGNPELLLYPGAREQSYRIALASAASGVANALFPGKAVGQDVKNAFDGFDPKQPPWRAQRYLHCREGDVGRLRPGLEWWLTRELLDCFGPLQRGRFALRFIGRQPCEVTLLMRVGLQTTEQKRTESDRRPLVRHWCDKRRDTLSAREDACGLPLLLVVNPTCTQVQAGRASVEDFAANT